MKLIIRAISEDGKLMQLIHWSGFTPLEIVITEAIKFGAVRIEIVPEELIPYQEYELT